MIPKNFAKVKLGKLQKFEKFLASIDCGDDDQKREFVKLYANLLAMFADDHENTKRLEHLLATFVYTYEQ